MFSQRNPKKNSEVPSNIDGRRQWQQVNRNY
jgi:hypothetical protein